MRSFLPAFFFLYLVTHNLAAQQAGGRVISFEWEPIPAAHSYDIEIYQDPSKNLVSSTSSLDARWEGTLPPGYYSLRTRSRDKRKVPGNWSPLSSFQVHLPQVHLISPQGKTQSSDATETAVQFQWKASEGATGYVLTLITADEANVVAPQKFKTESTTLEIKLPVARKYSWSVVATDQMNNTSDDPESEKNQALRFELWGAKLEKSKLETPSNGYVRELSWTQPDFLEDQDIALQRQDPVTKKWINVFRSKNYKNPSLAFSQNWDGGTYRFIVQNRAQLRPPSDLAFIQFPVVAGDRSPASQELAELRTSIHRTHGWVFLASYFLSSVSYNGINRDTGDEIPIEFSGALAGTGRMGLGYFAKDSPWGFTGWLEGTGIVVDQTNYTGTGLEFNAMGRHRAGSRGEFRHSFGLYSQDIWEFYPTGNESEIIPHRVSQLGGHYGLEYWFAFNQKLGLQIHGNIYQPISQNASYNGNTIIPSPNLEYGILGSYRLSKNLTSLAGWSFRKTELFYASTATGRNSVQIAGNYLNLYLEWTL